MLRKIFRLGGKNGYAILWEVHVCRRSSFRLPLVEAPSIAVASFILFFLKNHPKFQCPELHVNASSVNQPNETFVGERWAHDEWKWRVREVNLQLFFVMLTGTCRAFSCRDPSSWLPLFTRPLVVLGSLASCSNTLGRYLSRVLCALDTPSISKLQLRSKTVTLKGFY